MADTARRKPNRKPRPARPAQRLLTLSQIEIEYGIPRTTSRDLIVANKLAAVRLGNAERARLRVRREDLEALIARSTAA